MSESQNNRGFSPIGGAGLGFLRTMGAKKTIVAGAVATAVGLGYMGYHAGKTDPGLPSAPDDVGSSTISGSAPPQSPPAVVAAKPAEVKPPPTAVTKAADTVVAGNVDYVREPSTDESEVFANALVPAPKAPGPLAQADKAKDSGLTSIDFKPANLDGAKAGPAYDMTYVMRPQQIPCALDTAMDSTLAGSVFCHTTQPVLSSARIVLMPAGTQISGTYKNDVRNGQTRLFAFAGSAITPEGIPVPLNAGFADGLGRAGIQATSVDNHWGERFGAAIALTGAQSAMQLAQAEVSKGGNNYIDLSSGNGASGLATQILQSQQSIAPTITVSPGTIINVVVDHPIDFSSAIKVTTLE